MTVFIKYIYLLLISSLVLPTLASMENRFRIERFNDRLCLVDPDGSPFFSLGVNHIRNILQRPESEDINDECKEVYDNLLSWGFNTAGYGSPRPLCVLMPYFAPMYLTKNANYHGDNEFEYVDVFDPVIQNEFREIIQYEIAQQQDHPNLIGYYWTDTPQWDLKRAQETRGKDWVSAIRDLPDDAPGKKKYKTFIANGGKSDEEFLRLIARELYRVIGEETRRLAPDTLIFGERYLIHDHPDCVIEEALPYIDVLSIQPGGAIFPESYFDQLFDTYKKPILLCDHNMSFPTPKYPKTMWEQMENEDAAGKAYAAYLQASVKNPYIIGYQRCQYINVFETHLGVLKQGLLKEDKSPYKTIAEHILNANEATIHLFESQCAH